MNRTDLADLKAILTQYSYDINDFEINVSNGLIENPGVRRIYSLIILFSFIREKIGSIGV